MPTLLALSISFMKQNIYTTYAANKTASNNKLLKMEKDYTAATTVELILHSIWTISCWKTLDE